MKHDKFIVTGMAPQNLRFCGDPTIELPRAEHPQGVRRIRKAAEPLTAAL